MKRTLITLVIVLFAVGLAMAQTTTKAATQAQKPKAPQNKQFMGTVDSVTLADPAKGTKSEIVVANEKNEKMTFLVKSTTTISDADGKATTLDKIQKGNKCRVAYTTTPENVHEAVSIRLQK